MKKILIFFLLVLWVFLSVSCKEEDKAEALIAEIPLKLEVARFDHIFAQAAPSDLPKLKERFPYLFPKKFPDSVWLAKITSDTLQVELENEVLAAFPDFAKEEEALRHFFQHVKYYFPNYETPKVVTVISEVDYRNRIVLSDSLLLIGLDNYLGSGHRFYGGLSDFIAQGLDRQFLLSDVGNAFAKKLVSYPRSRSFLARMIYYGKELYLKDKLLPNLTDAQKINYKAEELKWAEENEEQIWRYFVENELLFSTATELDRRFLDLAPFSKFRLELDAESPARLGRYIGWQIVRSFTNKNPDVTLQQVLMMPAEQLFEQAKYKPKR